MGHLGMDISHRLVFAILSFINEILRLLYDRPDSSSVSVCLQRSELTGARLGEDIAVANL